MKAYMAIKNAEHPPWMNPAPFTISSENSSGSKRPTVNIVQTFSDTIQLKHHPRLRPLFLVRVLVDAHLAHHQSFLDALAKDGGAEFLGTAAVNAILGIAQEGFQFKRCVTADVCRVEGAGMAASAADDSGGGGGGGIE